jgi:hypothetical protein
MNLIVIGPAGSGKSTFVKSFLAYLRDKDYDVKAVNLDPASDPIYKAFADVREFVRAEEVMEKYKLGINGALIKSMEFVVKNVDEIILKADFVLYDTPGQMELFLYSKAGIRIIEEILKNFWTAGLFIVDSEVASTPENFISILAQSAVISLRTSLPTLTIFNKIDIQSVDFDLELLKKNLSEEEGVLSELLEKLLVFTEYTTVPYRPIKISSLTCEGFDDVFSAVNELFCSCGDIS